MPYVLVTVMLLLGGVGCTLVFRGINALSTGVLICLAAWVVLWTIMRRAIADTQRLLSHYNDLLAPNDGHGKPARSINDLLARIPTLAARLSETSHRLSRKHPITNLPTRELLLLAMEERWGSETQPLRLGIIDVLDFDRLCAFDQDSADRLLAIIAGKLVRMADPRRVVAHIDRSRFAILFAETDEQTAHVELEALSYALRDRLTEDAGALQPQIRSASVTTRPEAETPSVTLARAISALSAPVSGPSALIDPREAARQTYWLEQKLRQAIERQEFELLYQPFIDAGRGRICGAEALLRWRNAEAGNPSPALFIPIVERIGLAEEVGLWTLNTACRQAREWERAGHVGLKVAVNMSAHQLARPDLDALIKRTVEQHGLKSSLLEIELTETVAAIDNAQAKALLQRIRALGVSVSIDDFGAGYSSLSYLKQLVFDKLKIDREFVTDVHRHKDSQAICQSIIALARGLGIPVLAEGVETQDEYMWLRFHGCALFQGFYFSKPLSAADFMAFVGQPNTISLLTDTRPAAHLADITARLA